MVATLLTAGLAALIGVGALRVRGLLLAVSTFAFGLAASQYFYNRPILSAGQVESVPFLRTSFFGLDVHSQRTWYYVVLVALVIAVMITSRLRRTGIGRTTIGVRDNPEGASGYTVEPDVGEAPHVRARGRDRRPRRARCSPARCRACR